MKTTEHIAVIDIGKTNAKLAVVNMNTLTEIAVITRRNVVMTGGPWPHFDTEGHWIFLLNGLRDFHVRYGIQGISITTHGASVVLLNEHGKLAAPILDYEHGGPDSCADVYDQLRPCFDETGSPRLPGGLNIGAQLHWQFSSDPGLFARTKTIVTYPQYWAHRLTGIAASDVTSIGCHTDLWNPKEAAFSSLVDTLNIRQKLAPVRKSGDVLGQILPEIAQETGLPPETPVVCGIHDSNASLYPHIVNQTQPFSVVSTGTWVIGMSVGGSEVQLDGARDCLMNVNALGDCVPSARFMGGREFEIIQAKAPLCATAEDVASVLAKKVMLYPAVEESSGPFQGYQCAWNSIEPEVGSGEREVALSLYLAMMTVECLTLIGGAGDILLEGPFASNEVFGSMLAAATNRRVLLSKSATGTSIGAAMLFDAPNVVRPAQSAVEVEAAQMLELKSYATQWRKNIE